MLLCCHILGGRKGGGRLSSSKSAQFLTMAWPRPSLHLTVLPPCEHTAFLKGMSANNGLEIRLLFTVHTPISWTFSSPNRWAFLPSLPSSDFVHAIMPLLKMYIAPPPQHNSWPQACLSKLAVRWPSLSHCNQSFLTKNQLTNYPQGPFPS